MAVWTWTVMDIWTCWSQYGGVRQRRWDFSRAAVIPALATGFSQTYAVDIDGDGKPDIVAVNTPPKAHINPSTVQYTFTVFRNDGGGTFHSLGTFPLAPSFQTGNLCCAFYNIFGLSFADVNGDGKLDVLSQSNAVPQGNSWIRGPLLNVMLNNGDWTFGAPKPIDTSTCSNIEIDRRRFRRYQWRRQTGPGGGVCDQSQATNFVGAALGNGDGTFGASSQLTLINFITTGIANPQVQLIDFNADGNLDAVLGSGELALGNGDGTFTLSTPLFRATCGPASLLLSYALLQSHHLCSFVAVPDLPCCRAARMQCSRRSGEQQREHKCGTGEVYAHGALFR